MQHLLSPTSGYALKYLPVPKGMVNSTAKPGGDKHKMSKRAAFNLKRKLFHNYANSYQDIPNPIMVSRYFIIKAECHTNYF